ncbi:MAG: dehydrogenase [Firmicutes bacterium HGW-Firmicutes-9]|jgi:NADPH-dependent 2,4-dienoyl-CoA reductase/sulfur reductase-like enzyme/rhodanese-related sulfurtransferase|nr:MAG: dehydrogenase [Firmicutes bacterium HGW-Firmicutes-9]
MKIIVIGAVAAGTSAAAKARRNSEDAEITIYERDSFISYSGCGMPYFLGGEVEKAESLTPRDPAFFKSKYNVEIKTRHEVLSIDAGNKNVSVKDLASGEVFTDHYDKLIIATGARAVTPPIPGREKAHVFTLRNINDMLRIESFLVEKKPRTAAIVGTGFIGLEMCESLTRLGISVTLLEKLPQVTPGLDSDMAVYVEEHLKKNNITVKTGVSITQITEDSVVLADGTTIPAELTLLSTGIRPNGELAASAGVTLGKSGAILVNERMETNLTDVYACGDCTEQFHVVTGQQVYRPLGSTANKTGRIAGDCATGGNLRYRGTLGTGIFRVLGLSVGQTGLSEREAREAGYDIVVNHNIKPDKPEYLGGEEMVIKAVADRATGRILGVQIVGRAGVDKRIDVFATAISFGAKAEDLFYLDLAYAPPFSTTKDPVMYTGMILENAIHGGRPLMTAQELLARQEAGDQVTVIDARVSAQYEKAHVEGANSIPHAEIRDAAELLDQDDVVVTYCNKGTTGNAAQNILINKGFRHVYNLSGGMKQYTVTRKTIRKS